MLFSPKKFHIFRPESPYHITLPTEIESVLRHRYIYIGHDMAITYYIYLSLYHAIHIYAGIYHAYIAGSI